MAPASRSVVKISLTPSYSIGRPIIRRQRHRILRHRRQNAPDTIPTSVLSVANFREHYFLPGRPLVIKFGHPQQLPATKNWFNFDPGLDACVSRLRAFQQVQLPYELLYDPEDGAPRKFLSWLAGTRGYPSDLAAERLREVLPASEDRLSGPTMLRFHAELSLLLLALDFNKVSDEPLTRLYIAQASIEDLPEGLARDVPTPDLVRAAGKGDIYGSSVWLGLEPTYTPFHRDPNPNLLCQIHGRKVVRMLPPGPGEQVFREVQSRLGRQGNPRIRGMEMMDGEERTVFYDELWRRRPPGTLEARLDPGQGLFIPLGWWHTVMSGSGHGGRLNGSVNWWFR